jgi:hypothetical protein
VRRGDLRAEALLQLPALPTRSSAEGPAALWLTVGLLAADGLALQLRLRRNEKVGCLGCLPCWPAPRGAACPAGSSASRQAILGPTCLPPALQPTERDRVGGVWYAYHPVGGALTLLKD